MNYFLAKTDPDTYGIDEFENEGETVWDGVHNFQAINTIKSMRPGDQVYIYHSQSDKAIVGIASVIGEPYENKDDPRKSWAVRMKFIRRTKHLSLAEIKANPDMSQFLLVRNPRLSTMPVPTEMVKWVESKL